MLNLLSEFQNLKLQAAPASAADPCPNFAQSSPNSITFLTSEKQRTKTQKMVSKASLGAPQNLKKSERIQKVPVDVSFGMVLGKSLATRGPQEAQRTKTRGGNSNPIGPARSKHSLHFSTKLENVFESASACIHFGPHIATLGAKMRSNVSSGAFHKESEISSFFASRLGAKMTQKGRLKLTDGD